VCSSARLIRVLGLSLYGPKAASHRVRLSQFQPGLAVSGIHLDIQSLFDDAYLQRRFAGGRPSFLALFAAYGRRLFALKCAERFDLVIVHCELLPFLPAWLENWVLQVPFIYDCDDAFHLKYRQGRLGWLQPLLGTKIDRMMARALAVMTGNAELAAYARRFNLSVAILPSVVDTERYLPVSLPPAASDVADQTITVGWIGSPSTAPYLQELVAPLEGLAQDWTVRFLVIGGKAPAISGVEVIEQSWALEQEVSLIQQFDVGVMPLPDTPWARGKCAFKLIQCMACAIPVIASPVGANLDVVPPTCGFLASSADDWLVAFRQLAADPNLRRRMGAAGRQWVEEGYSLRSALPVLTSVIRRARTASQR
jgi:glycosyltransferase involved in cell wall biosynthesis